MIIKLKQFRKTHNLSQKHAAELLGYSYRSWVAYENATRKVPTHLLKHIELYNKYKEKS